MNYSDLSEETQLFLNKTTRKRIYPKCEKHRGFPYVSTRR